MNYVAKATRVAAVCTLGLLATLWSRPVAAGSPPPTTPCQGVAGSYIRADVTGILSGGATDLITLHDDGTGTWFQGNALSFFNTEGTFNSAIGSWTCGPNNTVVLTTINYFVADGNSDLVIATRATHQLQFNKGAMDNPVLLARVFIDFSLPVTATIDLLNPTGGTVTSVPIAAPRAYARVKPMPSDLARQ